MVDDGRRRRLTKTGVKGVKTFCALSRAAVRPFYVKAKLCGTQKQNEDYHDRVPTVTLTHRKTRVSTRDPSPSLFIFRCLLARVVRAAPRRLLCFFLLLRIFFLMLCFLLPRDVHPRVSPDANLYFVLEHVLGMTLNCPRCVGTFLVLTMMRLKRLLTYMGENAPDHLVTQGAQLLNPHHPLLTTPFLQKPKPHLGVLAVSVERLFLSLIQ